MSCNLNCLCCDWSGSREDAVWIDMSNFYDDSLCSNQDGSGMWECPNCEGPCEDLNNDDS
jgi:hypothetical protein